VMDPRFGDVSPEWVFKSPSDTLKPHIRLFTGTRDRHPGLAFGRGGCCAWWLSSFLVC
jgi:hypothetical protein